jgi:hypothetical protein
MVVVTAEEDCGGRNGMDGMWMRMCRVCVAAQRWQQAFHDGADGLHQRVAQHSTAQHSTAQHSTEQHST